MPPLFIIFCIFTLVQTANSSWWYLSQVDNGSVGDPRVLCHIIPNIHRKQKQICYRHAIYIPKIGEGTKHAITECKYQFKFHKWNCTTFDHDPSVFGKFMLKGATKELAFLNAMTTASAAYSLAKACTTGSVGCPCYYHKEKPKITRMTLEDQNQLHKRKGCQDPLKFAVDFVRRFVDADQNPARDAKATTYLHNNRVGRIAFAEFSMSMRICKCHGLSGSCTYKTCWRPLPIFRDIGDKLRMKYDEAIKISFNPTGRNILVDRNQKRPSKYNLIYLEESPDFCATDHTKGLVGTASRLCNADSEAEDSCDILCCGRGYESVKIATTYRCECKFIWCCEVQCRTCQGILTESYCKPSKRNHRSFNNSTVSSRRNRKFNFSKTDSSQLKRNLKRENMNPSSNSRRSQLYPTAHTFDSRLNFQTQFRKNGGTLSYTESMNSRKKLQRKFDYPSISAR